MSKLYPEDVIKLKNIIENPNFNVQNVSILFNFYLEQGYLTVVRATRNQLEVKIPNEEIRNEFLRLYEEYFTETWGLDITLVKQCALHFDNIFENPQKYLCEICNLMKKLFCKATLKDGHPLNEAALHHIIYFIILFTRYKCCTETYCNENRLDLALIFAAFGIIIEIKYNNNSVDAGLKQILDKHYYKIFENSKYAFQEIENYILLAINVIIVNNTIDIECSFLINTMKIEGKNNCNSVA